MNIKVLIILGVAIVIILALIAGIILFIKNSNSKYEVIDEDIVTKEKKEKTITKKSIKEKILKDKILKEENSEGLTNYNYYLMGTKEKVFWTLVGCGVLFVAAYIIYGSVLWSLAFSMIGLTYPKIRRKQIINKRKQELLLEFKEALYIISAALGAGQSVPNSFLSAYKDLEIIYGHKKKCYILEELLYINRKISRNETIEEALMDFAERSGLEDVRTFAEIFDTCNRLGGNLKKVIQTTSTVMNEKITIKQDIEMLVSGKKFESRLLMIIPFGLVVFMKLSSPEFLAGLSEIYGRIAATVSLLMIGIAALWAIKITNIEV